MSSRRGGHNKGRKPVRGGGHRFTPRGRLAASARAASSSYGRGRQENEEADGLWGYEDKNERDSNEEASSDDGQADEKESVGEDGTKTSRSQSSNSATPRRRTNRDENTEDDSDDEIDSSLRRFGTQNAPIDIENPNRTSQRENLKASDIASTEPREMSRREREAAEKAAARRRYLKLHAEGKTEQAQADLARLAVVRQQREEAAKRRKEEAEAKEAALQARLEREGRKTRKP